MSRSDRRLTPGATARALALTLLAVAAAGLTWRLRPGTSLASRPADTAVVTGCAWLAWGLAAYLEIALATSSLAELARGCGMAADVVARVAPARLRHLVETVVTVGVAASLATTVTPATAAAPDLLAIARPGAPVTESALDWPGLAAASGRPGVAATSGPLVSSSSGPRRNTSSAQARRANRRHRHGPAAASGPARSSAQVVVRSGDTLWAIAARQLRPGASDREITIAWHAWYAANRSVIGPDPDLIRPGQQLHAPLPGHPTHQQEDVP